MKKVNVSSSALTPFFEKIEQLSKLQRILIYAGIMVVVIGLSTYFLFWPKYQQVDTLNKQLASAQEELAKAKNNASELNDWRNKMNQKEAQYLTVMRALPEKEEIPSLLSGISQAGKDAGLEFLLFQPKGEVAKDFYAEIPVDISVSGPYHKVAQFFDKVANLPRIVNIRDIRMVPQTGKGTQVGMLTTACQAVTYKFIEPAPKPKAPTKKKKK